MIIIWQIILGSLFLFLSLLCFSLWPLALFKKTNIFGDDNLEKFVIISVFGLVLFTLAAYLLAFLNLRFLMWIFPVTGSFMLIKMHSKMPNFILNISHKFLFLAILIIGVIGQVAVNAPSGLPYQEGIYFYSSHGHDGVWHLALMEELQKNIFPFHNPEFSSHKLQNYHFFVDLLMSEFSRLFHFSTLDVYFRFMPLVFSILLGLSSFILVREWSKSEIAGIWAMIFTYFAGSFGYLIYIPVHKSLGGESIFWVSQTQSVLGNPPHAAAFVITATFLFCLLKYLNSRKTTFFLLCALLGGAVIEFKVYAGVLILGGLLVLAIFEALLKRVFKTFLLFFATTAIALVIYLPNSANSQEFLIWQPWWFIRTMVVAPDRLNWIDLELRRQTYIAENNWKRVIQVETMAFLIFLFGNLGMKFLGFWTIFKQLKDNIFKSNFNLFFLTITLTSFFIPVFFLQKGVAWNAIQFNQYFLLFFGFLAAISVSQILAIFKSQTFRLIISTLIVLLAIPTQIGLLMQFYLNKPLSKVSYEEIKALEFLGRQGKEEDIVLVAPFNRYDRDKYDNPPIPIYAWYDTGYVPAFSGKRTLISDEEQINIMGYDVNKILNDRKYIFESKDVERIADFFDRYKIDYVYLAWDQKFATPSATINMDLLYENKDARVYKVRK